MFSFLGGLPPQAVVRPPLVPTPAADSTTNPQVQVCWKNIDSNKSWIVLIFYR